MQSSSPPTTSGAEQKFSRYRSQRRAQNPAATSPPVEDNNSVPERTRSRYHRQRAPAQRTNPASPELNGDLQNSSDHRATDPRTLPSADRTLSPRAEAQRRQRLDENSASRQNDRSRGREHAMLDEPKHSYNHERNDSPLSPERNAKRISPPIQQAPRQIVAHRADEPIQDDREPGCFAFLRKKKVQDTSVKTEKTPIAKKTSEPVFIKQGGGGIVPGTDAPISAVNAGDRRVLIELGRQSMYFPVDATTTTADLLNSAANCFSDSIEPKSYVLVENFGKVGIRRPLRRYEHVRDVMNSWDDDLQNSFVVVAPVELSSDSTLLHASNVPHLKPQETSFLLQYSQKVGKWDKRQITIRQDGQLVSRKSPSDKDGTNICHLTDFDIYVPTARQMSKKIKPPKKNCFAIKSMQKTSMFETSSNFVHFFCVNDKAVATRFYIAIQSWRSWYLVNMLGEGQKKQNKSVEPAINTSIQRHTSVNRGSGGGHHQASNSMDSNYHLGSFKPLVDMNQFDERPKTSSDNASPVRKPSTRERAHPPLSLPKHMQNQDATQNRNSIDGAERTSGTFASSGLLGRTYSQRQRDLAHKESQASKPFTEGPSLLNNDSNPPYRPTTSDGLRRTTSTRQTSNPRTTTDIRRQPSQRNRGSVDLSRSASRRDPQQKPLVDLTPTYREPPQFQRKGKGYRPDQVGPGGLIDAATSPEEAISIPPSADWRGRGQTRDLHSSAGVAPGAGGGGLVASAGSAQQRGTSRSRNRSSSRNRGGTTTAGQTAPPQAARFQNTDAYAALTGGARPATSRDNDNAGLRRQFSGGNGERETDAAFVNGGLLEQAGGGWGGQSTGRGVVAGGNAGGPLVDLNEGTRFAQGSLLARQEMAEGMTGGRGVVIER